MDQSLRRLFKAGFALKTGFTLKRVFTGKFSSCAPPLLVGRRASGDGKAGKAWIGASPYVIGERWQGPQADAGKRKPYGQAQRDKRKPVGENQRGKP